MNTTTMKITDQLRRAVETSGMSRYRICKTIGMTESQMSRFMSGKGGLSMEMLDRIGEVLRLEVQAVKYNKRGA